MAPDPWLRWTDDPLNFAGRLSSGPGCASNPGLFNFCGVRAVKETTMIFKLTLKTLKPRNPLVLACRQRQAGSHRRCGGALRQQAAHALRRDIHRLHDSP